MRRKSDLSRGRGTKETFPQSCPFLALPEHKALSVEYVLKGLKGSPCLKGRVSSHSCLPRWQPCRAVPELDRSFDDGWCRKKVCPWAPQGQGRSPTSWRPPLATRGHPRLGVPSPAGRSHPASLFQNDTGTVPGDQGQAIATCCENLALSSPLLLSAGGRQWNGAFAHRTVRRAQPAAPRSAGPLTCASSSRRRHFLFQKRENTGEADESLCTVPRGETSFGHLALLRSGRRSPDPPDSATSSCHPHALPFNDEGSSPFQRPPVS